jgi:hypothetical protein
MELMILAPSIYAGLSAPEMQRDASRFWVEPRDVSKMCRFSMPPGYVRRRAAEKPKLGPLIPVIEAILVMRKKLARQGRKLRATQEPIAVNHQPPADDIEVFVGNAC